MIAQNDDRLDERIKDLFSADLLVAFQHATIFNWPSEYITKDEQYEIAQQILAEYAGYELHPAHIYYHVEMYVRNKHPDHALPYPTNAAYRPAKHKIGYLYSDLLLVPDYDPGDTSPSEKPLPKGNKNVSHETLYSIWLNSEQGTIAGEYISQAEPQTAIYGELEEVAKKPLFTKKQITSKVVIPPREPLFSKR
jgi:hypothetical protein